MAPDLNDSSPPDDRAIDDQELEAVQELADAREAIVTEVRKRIYGQQELIDHLLVAIFARGHSLLMGVPGLAKTYLISTLSEILNLDFNRIQFTPDLMPADITGTDILEEDPVSGSRHFKFMKGPVFTNLLLADEINRTPPKTQAALLESMAEYRVSAGGTTYELQRPFLVFATQNPIEQEGTYPLPEAQLDRFMFRLNVEYPSQEHEYQIVKHTTTASTPDVDQLLDAATILRLQNLVLKVPVSDAIVDQAVDLVRMTRPDEPESPDYISQYLNWGAGPRAGQALILGGKARALLDGRLTVAEEDVRALAKPILRHRILPNFQAEAEGIDADAIIERLLET